MRLSIEIPNQSVTELLTGHAGIYSPWLHEVGPVNSLGGCRVKFDREQDDEGSNKGRMKITRAKIRKGLAIFALIAPQQFALWIEGNDDAISFDCAWQAIIFGKLVYG